MDACNGKMNGVPREAPWIGPEDPREVERDLRSREESRKRMEEVQDYLKSTYENAVRSMMELTKVK